jgi:hypothetical protein
MRSWMQQDLGGAALVHGGIRLGDLFEGRGEVEDLAGVDAPVPDALEQVGQVGADRGGATAKPDVLPERRCGPDAASMFAAW